MSCCGAIRRAGHPTCVPFYVASSWPRRGAPAESAVLTHDARVTGVSGWENLCRSIVTLPPLVRLLFVSLFLIYASENPRTCSQRKTRSNFCQLPMGRRMKREKLRKTFAVHGREKKKLIRRRDYVCSARRWSPSYPAAAFYASDSFFIILSFLRRRHVTFQQEICVIFVKNHLDFLSSQ